MKTPELTPKEDQVLRLLVKGRRATQIAVDLKITRGRVSQIIRSLVDKDILFPYARSSYQPYQLTIIGCTYLNISGSPSDLNISPEGRDTLNIPIYAGLHRISYRYDVEKWSDTFEPDTTWPLKNWQPGKKNLPHLEIRVGTRCLECWWDERDAKSAHDAEERARLRSKVIQHDLEQVGFVFKGDPVRNRRWKHSILNDPLVVNLDSNFLKGATFQIDKTPKHKTLHLYEADQVEKHLETPDKIDNLYKRIETMETRLVQAINKQIDAIDRLIEKLTPKEPGESGGMYR